MSKGHPFHALRGARLFLPAGTKAWQHHSSLSNSAWPHQNKALTISFVHMCHWGSTSHLIEPIPLPASTFIIQGLFPTWTHWKQQAEQKHFFELFSIGWRNLWYTRSILKSSFLLSPSFRNASQCCLCPLVAETTYSCQSRGRDKLLSPTGLLPSTWDLPFNWLVFPLKLKEARNAWAPLPSLQLHLQLHRTTQDAFSSGDSYREYFAATAAVQLLIETLLNSHMYFDSKWFSWRVFFCVCSGVFLKVVIKITWEGSKQGPQ